MLKVTPYLELDQQAKQLVDRANNTMISLTFSESAVLYQLLIADSVCGKEALLDAGWPDRVVAATSLTQCVSTLRKKLEAYPEVQLKTVARRGYELYVSKRSHIKMLAVNDAESIKTALIDVPMMVKIGGILVLLLFILWSWYTSDYHSAVKNSSLWNTDKKVALNIGGTKEIIPMFYQSNVEYLHPSMWQKHLAPESNHLANFEGFEGYVATDGDNYSMAICPNVIDGECAGHNLMNITAIDRNPAGLDISHFSELAERLEKRIRYNRIIIPHNDNDNDNDNDNEVGDITEHHYHADVYFPVAGELLVRSDLSLSLIYEDDNSGQFYSATCITDEDCLTTPIKYKVRGTFKQYEQKINDLTVDVFQVKVSQKEFIKPEVVSPSAMNFYRAIRKHDITDDVLYFYRVHTDEKSAVWISPILGSIVAWYKYDQVRI
ncbi:winged helix-turn-helix domain-containing protein [Shewanella gelidimarina]|uniref:winged helix-turn-helix domain-containing protein n=1 Tax=Shewanella gelidimarina TaxID=56813 RepID=UPI00200C5082|nr:winged helix-turn-helix domain-containing protein [Shewanella gelidimarina]MCL1056692.1 winged helix-turn-helix domain-containing protein [Shewanella gelidimarina]